MRRCTLNGLMIGAGGTRTGLGLRTRRLQIRVLPRVLEIERAKQALSRPSPTSCTGGRLASTVLPLIEQGSASSLPGGSSQKVATLDSEIKSTVSSIMCQLG